MDGVNVRRRSDRCPLGRRAARETSGSSAVRPAAGLGASRGWGAFQSRKRRDIFGFGRVGTWRLSFNVLPFGILRLDDFSCRLPVSGCRVWKGTRHRGAVGGRSRVVWSQ